MARNYLNLANAAAMVKAVHVARDRKARLHRKLKLQKLPLHQARQRIPRRLNRLPRKHPNLQRLR